MAEAEYDAVVIGAGHNGLVAAAYLAQAGARVAILEKSAAIGGAARSEETWPGYTVSTASYVCSLFDPVIVRELELEKHGFSAYRKEPASFTPLLDGRSLLLGSDAGCERRGDRTLFRLRRRRLPSVFRKRRGARRRALRTLGRRRTAPGRSSTRTVREQFDLPVSAYVERFVETPVLQATLATDGLIGTYAGPRDAGTTYVLAHHYAGRMLGEQGAWGFVRGGMGAVSAAVASAARAAGVDVHSGVEVMRIARNGRMEAQCADGRSFAARAILSNADPKTTFLDLCATDAFESAFLERVRAWRSEGVSFKINLALGGLPDFSARPGTNLQAHHKATIHVAPDIDYLQRAHDDARARGASRAPMLECFMQTPTDTSLAPAGKHILSIFAQYFPYSAAVRWNAIEKRAIVRTIIESLAQYAPNLLDLIEDWDILSPADIEARIGISGGHIFHGELLPGQIFEDRFNVRTPLDGLYLCGSGTHPGGCVTGVPGRRAARAVLADLKAVV